MSIDNLWCRAQEWVAQTTASSSDRQLENPGRKRLGLVGKTRDETPFTAGRYSEEKTCSRLVSADRLSPCAPPAVGLPGWLLARPLRGPRSGGGVPKSACVAQ